MHSLKPEMQRNVALLKDGADLDSERLPAGVALVQPDASALAFERAAPIDNAAVRADTAIRPDMRLDVGVGGFFVAEPGFVENRAGHGLSPWPQKYPMTLGMSTPISRPIENI